MVSIVILDALKKLIMFVKVAVPGPFLTPLDYKVSDDPLDADRPIVGGRVWVPFRQKKLIGLVMSLSETSDLNSDKIKPIDSVVDQIALFSTTEMAFLNWASHYYHEPIGQVVQAALPKRLRAGEPQKMAGVSGWQLTDLGQNVESALPERAAQQRAVWSF